MEFLLGASKSNNDAVKAYILHGGWAESTIKHYNTGVSKLVTFAKIFNIPREELLPIKPEYLYQFVLWAGPQIPRDDQLLPNSPIKSSTI